ncbi:hypothetical protein AB4305_30095 [Nocardia sp. 2YAB30]|uniref:hypothetical protein n=1 Tax=unclassified Nocardia TaxID=2637762 RepID=UPI003F951A94
MYSAGTCRTVARDLRDLYAYEPIMWAELSKPVEQLEAGRPYRFSRYELPVDHPERWPAGDSNDLLVLDADENTCRKGLTP